MGYMTATVAAAYHKQTIHYIGGDYESEKLNANNKAHTLRCSQILCIFDFQKTS